ncbi:hypothetical protein T4B_8686 [Trichinella pseudospiralis]|uniref:Uncharacterized protein n=1 Tax=Trichinella pseudospiralis TaxID=6337 RepID=A0A0V1H8E5_TRIPS|nr:hypothetical protein T4A_4923 [Trichinella pseudospiralis]KRZ06620.1 hypothetical protein T4B_8686 [Trichinella pseudospiralis]KRZ40245.1 hypothetical protein T4C_5448 [Trichinella pseudospiralis]
MTYPSIVLSPSLSKKDLRYMNFVTSAISVLLCIPTVNCSQNDRNLRTLSDVPLRKFSLDRDKPFGFLCRCIDVTTHQDP